MEATMGNIIPNPPTEPIQYAGLCKEYSAPGQSPIWSDGEFLYAPHRAIFPKRCTMCNKSDPVHMHIVKLQYTPKFALFLSTFVGGAIAGYIAQLLFSRSITVQLGACRRCNLFAGAHTFFSTLLSFAALALILAGHFLHERHFLLAGLACLPVLLIFLRLFPRPVRVLEISDNVARIGNVSPAFLNSIA
jgi:hypothetical protein